MTTVNFGNGLEEIGELAFVRCRSLVRIDIPPNVRAIKDIKPPIGGVEFYLV